MKKNIAIATTGILAFIGVAYFFSHFYFAGPKITLEWPCFICRGMVVPITTKNTLEPPKNKIFEPTKTPVKPLTDKELILSKKNGTILWRIYGLESTWGKNDGCKSHGEFNGYGYGQNGDVWNCFPSFDVVTTKVDAWFEKNLKTLSLSESLCLYNTGKATKSCDYYKNYLTIN